MPLNILRSNIKYLRGRKKWTQKQMGDMLGVSYKMIDYMQRNGTIRNETIIKLSQLFGCTIDDLCRRDFRGNNNLTKTT